jgi:hypothetical protein
MVGGDVLGVILTREIPAEDHIAFWGLQSKFGIYLSPHGYLETKDRKPSGVYFRYPDGRAKGGMYEAPHIVAKGFSHIAYWGNGRSKGTQDIACNFKTCKDPDDNFVALVAPGIILRYKRGR